MSEQQQRAERAAHAVQIAVADFRVALLECRNVTEALAIHQLVEECLASLDAMSASAAERADRLCGVIS